MGLQQATDRPKLLAWIWFTTVKTGVPNRWQRVKVSSWLLKIHLSLLQKSSRVSTGDVNWLRLTDPTPGAKLLTDARCFALNHHWFKKTSIYPSCFAIWERGSSKERVIIQAILSSMGYHTGYTEEDGLLYRLYRTGRVIIQANPAALPHERGERVIIQAILSSMGYHTGYTEQHGLSYRLYRAAWVIVPTIQNRTGCYTG